MTKARFEQIAQLNRDYYATGCDRALYDARCAQFGVTSAEHDEYEEMRIGYCESAEAARNEGRRD